MSAAFSIIDIGTEFDGKLLCKGKMIINGMLKGSITGENITVGEQGYLFADTISDSLIIGGRFQGKAESATVTVLSTGYCEGEIVCKNLVVEPGGVLNAQVTRLTRSSDFPEKTG